VSDHSPHDDECKNLEFDHADFGILGLETAFSLGVMHSGLPLEELIEKLTSRPRAILRLPSVRVAEGQPANLTVFSADEEWTYNKSYSKSRNSPFLGQTLKGRAVGVINQKNDRWFS
jgi:dihydroorotase